MISQIQKEVCFFTVVSRNYLHFAKTLVNSILTNNPGAKCFVVLCDEMGDLDLSQEPFEVISIRDLDIKNIDDFIFRYSILELNTAIKPYVIELLFNEGWHKVVYFDPDIKVYQELKGLNSLLDEYQIILTPHLTGFLDDEKKPGELEILQSGTYNLGFIALKNTEQTVVFVKWWQEKLYKDCVVDIPKGLFVDQKWMDLVPAIFDNVYINRNEGWNVAYWNLHHRHVLNSDDGYRVNGQPLMFFHFSGFSPKTNSFSKHQNRFTRKSVSEAVKQICSDYEKNLIDYGFSEYKDLPYAFGFFIDGTPIPDVARVIYRDELDWEVRDYGLNTETGCKDFMGYLNEFIILPSGENRYITRLAYKYYQIRADLKIAFPDISGYDNIRYAHWFIENAVEQMNLDEKFIEPLRHEISLSESSNSRLEFRLRSSLLYKLTYKVAWSLRPIVRPVLSPDYRQRISGFLLNKAYKREVLDRTDKVVESDEPGVNIIGYMYAESGIGQSARSNVDALKASGVDFSVSDFQKGNVSRMEATFDENLIGEPKYCVNLFHINADQMAYLMLHRNDLNVKSKYNIGYWAWELPDFPTKFAESAKFLDEIWTPSEFCRKAIAAKVTIPVKVVPHAITLPQDFESKSSCKLLDSIENNYFISVFDCLSVPQRKNIDAVIDAFELAFGVNSQNITLLIKTSNLEKNKDFQEYLINKIDENPSIKLIDKYLEKEEILTLLKGAKALVSLHRSEGFGLVIAEAMAVGTPVIVTGWSGNMDFTLDSNALIVKYDLIDLDEDHGPYQKGNTWADPDIKHAAELLKDIIEQPILAKQRAEKAREFVANELSAKNLGRIIKERLLEIQAL